MFLHYSVVEITTEMITMSFTDKFFKHNSILKMWPWKKIKILWRHWSICVMSWNTGMASPTSPHSLCTCKALAVQQNMDFSAVRGHLWEQGKVILTNINCLIFATKSGNFICFFYKKCLWSLSLITVKCVTLSCFQIKLTKGHFWLRKYHFVLGIIGNFPPGSKENSVSFDFCH